MDAHVAALNARDDEALFLTMHTPHVRISTAGIAIYPTLDDLRTSYLREFSERAGSDWDHTVFESKDVIHSSENKAHVFLQFTRYDNSGNNIGTFRSLWIRIRKEGRGEHKLDQASRRDYTRRYGRKSVGRRSREWLGEVAPEARLLPVAGGILS